MKYRRQSACLLHFKKQHFFRQFKWWLTSSIILLFAGLIFSTISFANNYGDNSIAIKPFSSDQLDNVSEDTNTSEYKKLVKKSAPQSNVELKNTDQIKLQSSVDDGRASMGTDHYNI